MKFRLRLLAIGETRLFDGAKDYDSLRYLSQNLINTDSYGDSGIEPKNS